MPLEIPQQRLSPLEFDQLLEHGYRRSGIFFYRTQCPECQACKPIRIPVDEFRPSRSQRRVWKKCESSLTIQVATPSVDRRRVELFNEHRESRGLNQRGTIFDIDDYQSFLLSACCDVIELSLWLNGKLIAVSITDVGAASLSAVYCYFSSDASIYSPGTYAILKQIDLAQQHSKQWLYLGLYVSENQHLNYKARFCPHEQLDGGKWRAHETSPMT